MVPNEYIPPRLAVSLSSGIRNTSKKHPNIESSYIRGKVGTRRSGTTSSSWPPKTTTTTTSSNASLVANSVVHGSSNNSISRGSVCTASTPYNNRNVLSLGLVDRETIREEKSQNKKLTVACCTLAVCSLVTALSAMFIEMSLVAYIAFVIPLLTAPYVVGQRRQLNKLPSFRAVLNLVRLRVTELAQQNKRLRQENDRLAFEASRLSLVTKQLEQIVQQQGGDMKKVKYLIKENGSIQREMKRLQHASELQVLFTTMLRSNPNGDFRYSEDELDILVDRLKSFYSCSHLTTFDAQKVRDALSQVNKNYDPSANGENPNALCIYQVASDMIDNNEYLNNFEEADPSEYEAFDFPRSRKDECNNSLDAWT